MASFSAGTTFTDGVANDVTAAKLAALVNNATPTSGLIQDRTAETITATNDTLLIGDASDSNNLKRITVANFAQTLPTAKITTGTIATGTFGTTTSTAATITSGTIPTLTAGTTTGTAASFSGDLTIADKIVHSGDTNTAIRFPAADTVTVETSGAERLRVDSSGNVGIGTTSPVHKFVVSSSGSQGIEVNPTSSTLVDIYLYNRATTSYIDSQISARNLIVSTGVGSPTERLRIDSSGQVGIGTDSPATYMSAYSGSANGVVIADSGVPSIIFADTGSTTYSVISQSGTTLQLFNDAAGPTIFYTNGTERLRIDSDGDVGIGTTAPVSKLTIQGNASDQIILRDNATDSQSKGATYSGAHYTNAEEPVLVAGGFSTSTQNIVYVGGGWISGNTATDIRFFTAANNTTVTGTERLRIDSDGDVSIGTATALSKLHVHGNITFSNTTTATSASTSTITPPATVAGYLTVSINGTSRKIPYYAT